MKELCEQECWYLHTLDPSLKECILEQHSEHTDLETVIIDTLREMFPMEQETIEFTSHRAIAAKQEMFDYVKSDKKFGNGMDDGKLAIVGHSMFFKLLTTKEEYWNTIFRDPTHPMNGMLPNADYSFFLLNC